MLALWRRFRESIRPLPGHLLTHREALRLVERYRRCVARDGIEDAKRAMGDRLLAIGMDRWREEEVVQQAYCEILDLYDAMYGAAPG